MRFFSKVLVEIVVWCGVKKKFEDLWFNHRHCMSVLKDYPVQNQNHAVLISDFTIPRTFNYDRLNVFIQTR